MISSLQDLQIRYLHAGKWHHEDDNQLRLRTYNLIKRPADLPPQPDQTDEEGANDQPNIDRKEQHQEEQAEEGGLLRKYEAICLPMVPPERRENNDETTNDHENGDEESAADLAQQKPIIFHHRWRVIRPSSYSVAVAEPVFVVPDPTTDDSGGNAASLPLPTTGTLLQLLPAWWHRTPYDDNECSGNFQIRSARLPLCSELSSKPDHDDDRRHFRLFPFCPASLPLKPASSSAENITNHHNDEENPYYCYASFGGRDSFHGSEISASSDYSSSLSSSSSSSTASSRSDIAATTTVQLDGSLGSTAVSSSSDGDDKATLLPYDDEGGWMREGANDIFGSINHHFFHHRHREGLYKFIYNTNPSSTPDLLLSTTTTANHAIPPPPRYRKKPGRTYRCKQCDYAAASKAEYWSHSRTHIKSHKLLSCPKCPFVTEHKHHLEYHMRNHFGSKPFKCDECLYSCVNRAMLKSHMKSHTNHCEYRCADCPYATKYCHSLKMHLQKHSHRAIDRETEAGDQ